MFLQVQSFRQQSGEQKGGADVDGGEDGRAFIGASVLQSAEEQDVQQNEKTQACTAERQRVTAVQGWQENRSQSQRAGKTFRQGRFVLQGLKENAQAADDRGRGEQNDKRQGEPGVQAVRTGEARRQELDRLKAAAEHAHKIGLSVNAGHGIDYENIAGILEIPHLSELNIGHSIIGRAIMVGMERAVGEMLEAMKPYSK